jgi:hypothetical protein
MIRDFIWDKKPAKIKYKCLINTIEEGGLRLQDLDTKIKAIKLKWYKLMIDKETVTPWKAYINTHFKEDVSRVLSYNSNTTDIPHFGDSFYTELFDTWATLHCRNPTTAEDIARQPLYNNAFIRIDNKTIKPQLIDIIKMKYVQDLLGPDMLIAKKEYLDRKFGIHMPYMLYNSLVSSIPKDWKTKIKQDHNILNYYVFEDHKISLNNVEKKVIEITTKELYWSLISTISQRPTSEKTWEQEVGLGYGDDDWSVVYTTPYRLTKDTKVLMFQYKVSHRILACKYKLHIWGIEPNDICNWCNSEKDILEHHLVACPKTLSFWDHVFNWFKTTTLVSFPIDTYDIILGIPNPNEETVIDQLNYTILQGKYYVYKCKQMDKTIDCFHFLISLKQTLELKQASLSSRNAEKEFEKIWQPLLEKM